MNDGIQKKKGNRTYLIRVEPSDWLTCLQVEYDAGSRCVGCDHSIRIVTHKIH